MRDQETRSRKREEQHRERLERLEKMVFAQHEKLDTLETLVYRIMHRDAVEVGEDSGRRESPKYEEYSSDRENHQASHAELPASVQDGQDRHIPMPDRTKPYYSISSV